MKTLIAFALVSGFALASATASAAELTDPDRSELRQRAEAFQAERSRNPNFQPGEGRLSPQTADSPPRQARGVKKTAAKSAKREARAEKTEATAKPETRRQKAAKKARSLKNVRGAFVRR